MEPEKQQLPFLPMTSGEGERARLAATPKPSENLPVSYADSFTEEKDLDEMLYARHAEIKSFDDLMQQRGTNIPALYNQVYKFIQNPSTVSVETYKRMVDTDETVGSCVDFLATCLAARLGRYTHTNTDIAKFVNEVLEGIDGGWTNSLKEIFSACWAGFSVAEKVWANTEKGFVIKKLVQMPPGTIMFETDRTGELTPDGILQYQRNYNPALFGAGIAYLFGFTSGGPVSPNAGRPDIYAKLGDYPFPLRSPNIFSYLSIRIPVRKCVHYAFDAAGKFGSPYGRSLLRRAYKHWVLKDATLQMLATALDRKGTPLSVWYVDPTATFIDTNTLPSGPNNPATNMGVRAQHAVLNAVKNVHNDSTIIMPGKKGQFVEHDFVQQTSNAADFIAALNYYDTRIMRAMLMPALVMSNGDGSGSYALGAEHAKTFDKLLDGVLGGAKQVLLRQIVREIIAYNYPRALWEKDGLGEFSERELSQDEREKEMQCVETAVNLGAIDMNELDDLNKVRDIAGFKPRDKPIEQEDLPGDGEDDNEEDEHPPKQ